MYAFDVEQNTVELKINSLTYGCYVKNQQKA